MILVRSITNRLSQSVSFAQLHYSSSQVIIFSYVQHSAHFVICQNSRVAVASIVVTYNDFNVLDIFVQIQFIKNKDV